MAILDLAQLDVNKVYSYADYLTWQFEERVELLRGYIAKMSPAPNLKHQTIIVQLMLKLGNFLEDKKCQVFVAPFDVRLPISSDLEVSKKYKKQAATLSDGKIMTVVQPDICVICDENKLDEKGAIGAPTLIIEVLSPGNTKREMKDKFEIYQEAGVEEYWLVEPHDEFILVYTLQGDTYVGSSPYMSGDILKSSAVEGFELVVSKVF